jgi:hypothetical protein
MQSDALDRDNQRAGRCIAETYGEVQRSYCFFCSYVSLGWLDESQEMLFCERAAR